MMMELHTGLRSKLINERWLQSLTDEYLQEHTERFIWQLVTSVVHSIQFNIYHIYCCMHILQPANFLVPSLM